MAHPAKTALASFKKEFDPHVVRFMDEYIKEAIEMDPLAEMMAKETKAVALGGGKRLRPALVKYSYQMFGGKDMEAIMDIALAIEMIHLYLLIEDDFMDKAGLRHNTPTINKVFGDSVLDRLDKDAAIHYGNSMAALAAMLVAHRAIEKVSTSNFAPELVRKGMTNLNRHMFIVCFGQTLDIDNEITPNISTERIEKVLEWKTASYTYENPLHMGAIFAGASDEDLKALTEYAIPAGIAFQIQDDILGLFGTEKKIGKPIISDLKEGKRTLLIKHALEKGTKGQKDIINHSLGNSEVRLEDLEKIKKIVEETGSLENAKKVAERHVKESLLAIHKIEKVAKDKDSIKFLQGIADYMINRDL